MFALVRKSDGEVEAIVESTAGHDLAPFDVVEVPGDPRTLAWSRAARAFAPRPPAEAEVTAAALEADPHWQALKRASPEQIEAWLRTNCTSLADARKILKFVLLALQKSARTRT